MTDLTESSTHLSEGEVRLIDAIGEHQASQRSLARESGLSLGMTNLLIKRLVKKGLIKVATMNGRTLSYMLTPVGFAEKLRRSYDFISTSIRYIAETLNRIRTIVTDVSPDKALYVLGNGELAALAEETLRSMQRNYTSLPHLKDLPENGEGICLICQSDLISTVESGSFVMKTLI